MPAVTKMCSSRRVAGQRFATPSGTHDAEGPYFFFRTEGDRARSPTSPKGRAPVSRRRGLIPRREAGTLVEEHPGEAAGEPH